MHHNNASFSVRPPLKIDKQVHYKNNCDILDDSIETDYSRPYLYSWDARLGTTEAAAADVTAIAAAVEASVADESKLRDKDQAAETAVSGKEANCDTNEKYSAYVNQVGRKGLKSLQYR